MQRYEEYGRTLHPNQRKPVCSKKKSKSFQKPVVPNEEGTSDVYIEQGNKYQEPIVEYQNIGGDQINVKCEKKLTKSGERQAHNHESRQSCSTNDTIQQLSDYLSEETCKRVNECYSKHARVGEPDGRKSFCLRSPPPSQHLKKILSNYPDSPQIFKEALQNADDAQGSCVNFLLDERTFLGTRCEGEYSKELKRFLGPALVIQNDSLFEETDWDALQNMFESNKVETPEKIGRFGMGSRSYFHLTDIVMILSGDRLVFLDPDWILTRDGGGAGILSTLNDYTDECRGQDDTCIEKLHTFLCCFDQLFGFHKGDLFYDGTMIRLPLRLGRWARTSSFAPYEYTVDKVSGLLKRFQAEASQCLLFLQSVYQIQIWRWSYSEDKAQLIFNCSIRATGTHHASVMDAHHSRSAIHNFLKRQRLRGNSLKSCLCQADTGHLPEIDDVFQIEEVVYSTCVLDSNQAQEVDINTQLWLLHIRLVCNSDLVALLPYSNCPPIIGIAVATGPSVTQRKKRTRSDMQPVKDSTGLPSQKCMKQLDMALLSVANEEAAECQKIRQGVAFTYLPLADVCTGLPVHIHGTFQLTDNRRSIWMATSDTEGQVKKWSQWNETLLRIAMPQLYARVLLQLAQLTTQLLNNVEEEKQKERINDHTAECLCRYLIDNYYAAWPDPSSVSSAFQPMLFELVRFLKDQKVMIREPQSLIIVSKRLATSSSLTLNETITSCLFKRDVKNLPPLKSIEACFLNLTEVEKRVFEKQDTCLYEAVAQCQLLGHPVILVPETVKRLLLKYNRRPQNTDRVYKDLRLGLRKNTQRGGTDIKNPNGPYSVVTFLEIFSRVLLPHWASLPHDELRFVPHFHTLMLFTCKVLGRGPDKAIQQFEKVCSRLVFVPVEIPGVVDDDYENAPLRAPRDCFDPCVSHLNLAAVARPAKDFRAPDVLRVLRVWGLRRSLRWDEMAQEAMVRMCVIGGCRTPCTRSDEMSSCSF